MNTPNRKGKKNLIPSLKDQRNWLKRLREQADAGDMQAAGQLVLIAQVRSAVREANRAAA